MRNETMAPRRSRASVCGLGGLGGLVMLTLIGACMVTTSTDDTAEPSQAADSLIQPASEIKGSDCGVDYTFTHHTGVVFVSQSSLQVVSTSIAVANGSRSGIISVTHVDSGEVDPTALADNQTPETSFTLQAELGLVSDPPVTSTTTWRNPTQFSNANLCTAIATSFLVVRFSDSPNCSIRRSTSFPSCVPVR